MTSEIKQKISNYIALLDSLMGSVQSVTVRSNDMGTHVARDLLARGGGTIAAELFGREFMGLGKKVTRKYLDQRTKQMQQMDLHTYEGQFNFYLREIQNFLSGVSIKKRNLSREGNSHQLLKKFVVINSYKKLETKIKKAISALQAISYEPLIYNKDIPEPRPEPSHAYEILKHLETSLRTLIERSLGSLTPNWWIDRIPNDVREKAELLKSKNQRIYPWYNTRDDSPIAFVDFNDYVKIIRRKDNWREVFSRVFKEEDLISAKLKELEPIRNAIAHSRELTIQQTQVLKLNSEQISDIVRNRV